MLRIVVVFALWVIGFGAFAATGDSVQIYIFFSETCPICQSATLSLKELHTKYGDKGVAFTAVFPNTEVSTKKSLAKFSKKYKVPFEHNIDAGRRLTKMFNATTTPEVVVVKATDNTVLYRGKIDNSFEAIGKRRTVVTERYLDDALNAIVNNQPVQIKETKPVGCFIIKQNQ